MWECLLCGCRAIAESVEKCPMCEKEKPVPTTTTAGPSNAWEPPAEPEPGAVVDAAEPVQEEEPVVVTDLAAAPADPGQPPVEPAPEPAAPEPKAKTTPKRAPRKKADPVLAPDTAQVE